jgi:flagellin
MGLRINNNVEALNAHRNLMNTSMKLGRSMERLSSGYRINRAADDAAGLGISERMRAQIGGVAQAQRNAQDGISLVQTAEGALQEMHSILGRIRDLAVQFNNGIYDAGGMNAITGEVIQLSAELDRMIASATFNGFQLLSAAGALCTLQVGPNNGETMVLNGVDAATSLGTEISTFAGLTTPGTVNLQLIDDAITNIANNRSTFGAVQNRLEHTINSLGVYQENLQAAESRIRDTDMAAEMTEFTRLQILQQSGTAMLAQANMLSQGVLQLMQ